MCDHLQESERLRENRESFCIDIFEIEILRERGKAVEEREREGV